MLITHREINLLRRIFLYKPDRFVFEIYRGRVLVTAIAPTWRSCWEWNPDPMYPNGGYWRPGGVRDLEAAVND
jgi:hypothetical protein